MLNCWEQYNPIRDKQGALSCPYPSPDKIYTHYPFSNGGVICFFDAIKQP